MRSEDFLQYLTFLAKCPKIKFIVTVDEINSCWLMDEGMLDAFNFVNFKIDTFEPYTDEKEY